MTDVAWQLMPTVPNSNNSESGGAQPRRASVIGAVLAFGLLASCAATSEAPSETLDSAVRDSQAEIEVIAEGLEAPWSITFYGETPLVSERDSGRILEVDSDGATREVAVIEGVEHGGEGGLLGIAVREDTLYAYFTAPSENRVERFALGGDAESLTLSDGDTIIDGIPAANNHNGGRIAFGPDGMLYVTTGDAGDSQAAQDLGSLAGKILRVTPEGEIPSSNPFAESPVYSYGHRNPQGMTWDENGTMYSSEFGQNTWDELNIIEAGGNYGWPEAEGTSEQEGLIDPVQQWGTSEASPSGITILNHDIYIANLRGERLRRVPLAELEASTEYFVGEHGRLRDAVVTPDGSLWILTNNTDGRGTAGPNDDRILRVGPGD
ncbi:MAG: PQQ-dependent sugar dehydrogenase [Leucobacter sp.]